MRARHIRAFAIRVAGQEVYGKEIADRLEEDLKALRRRRPYQAHVTARYEPQPTTSRCPPRTAPRARGAERPISRVRDG